MYGDFASMILGERFGNGIQPADPDDECTIRRLHPAHTRPRRPGLSMLATQGPGLGAKVLSAS